MRHDQIPPIGTLIYHQHQTLQLYFRDGTLVRSWSGCVRVWSAATLPTASRPLGVLFGVSRLAVTSRLVPVLSKLPVYQPFRSLRHVSAKLVSEPSGLKTRGHVAARKNPTSDKG